MGSTPLKARSSAKTRTARIIDAVRSPRSPWPTGSAPRQSPASQRISTSTGARLRSVGRARKILTNGWSVRAMPLHIGSTGPSTFRRRMLPKPLDAAYGSVHFKRHPNGGRLSARDRGRPLPRCPPVPARSRATSLARGRRSTIFPKAGTTTKPGSASDPANVCSAQRMRLRPQVGDHHAAKSTSPRQNSF